MFMCIWSTLFVILWVESEMAASVYYSTSVYLNVLNRYSTMQWDAGLVFTLSGLSLSSLCFIFQSDIHRNLHLRVCHQSHGTRVHLGSVHLPQRRVELARFHRHHTSVSVYIDGCVSWPTHLSWTRANAMWCDIERGEVAVKPPPIRGSTINLGVNARLTQWRNKLQVHHDGNRPGKSSCAKDLPCTSGSKNCRHHSR